jgi:sugar/nucleoside kinase (ribokinase family)
MNRAEIARSASARLAGARAGEVRATIGLDGFVDEICAVVETRADFETYAPVATIADLGRKISAAAGQSSNYELVVKRMKLGGNGPIMAHALATAGVGVTYVGATGFPSAHPVFAEFAERAEVIGISEPAHTDAVEFGDGKLMLGKLTPLTELTWERLVERVGLERLVSLLEGSRLIAMNNWTMVPHMSAVLRGMLREVIPKLSPTVGGARRIFFVDLADPEKRTRGDLAGVMKLLGEIQAYADVTLGLNLKESEQVAEVIGLPTYADPEPHIEVRAAAVRERLGIACVVIHPRKGAAAADQTGATGTFLGPFVRSPKISTGAGDHFNAGFALGRVLGLSLVESLSAGVGTSGFYVREGHSPSMAELVGFLAELPGPE